MLAPGNFFLCRTIPLILLHRGDPVHCCIFLLADIPQMTSKFAQIVPRPHLQGNSVPIAAIR